MVGFDVLLQPFRVPTLLAQHFVHPWPPYESLTDSLVARIPRPARLKHAAAAIVCLLTVAAQASAAPSCRVPGGHTVATDRIARLIGVPTPVGNALYACIRRTGRKVPLDIGYLGEWKTPFWVGDENRGELRRIGFEATAKIDRHDFGVSWQDEIPGGGVVVSNEIELVLDVEAILLDDLERTGAIDYYTSASAGR